MRVKKQQYIPVGPEPLFLEVVHDPTAGRFYRAQLKDFQDEFAPTFDYSVDKKHWLELTPQIVARLAAGELAEARGIVTLTRWEEGIPTGHWVFIANGRQVFEYRRASE